jgi:hypothetical protein
MIEIKKITKESCLILKSKSSNVVYKFARCKELDHIIEFFKSSSRGRISFKDPSWLTEKDAEVMADLLVRDGHDILEWVNNKKK